MDTKIQGDETKEPKTWETKFGEKLQKKIQDRNCRNEFTGGKLRQGN